MEKINSAIFSANWPFRNLALDSYNFIRGFGRAHKLGGVIAVGGGRAYKRNKKILWNDEIKLNVSEKHIKANIPLHVELHL